MRFSSDGLVSLWVGQFASVADLDQYIDFVFDEDGNAASAFSSTSGMGWFDHDTQEAAYLGEQPQDPQELLSRFSHGPSFAQVAATAISEGTCKEWNSVVLLYDCAYNPSRGHPSQSCRLTFVGAFPYARA